MNYIETTAGSKLLNQYLRKYKGSSAKVVGSDIRNFFKTYTGEIEDLSENDVALYFSGLNVSQKSIMRKTSILSRFFSFLEKRLSGFKNPIGANYGNQLKYHGNYYASQRFQQDLLNWERSLNVRTGTKLTYKPHIMKFFQWYQDSPKSITLEKLKLYKKFLDERYSDSTTFLKFISIKSFLRYCIGNKVNALMSIRDLNLTPPKKDKGYYNVLQADEIQELLEQPDLNCSMGIRDKSILYLLAIYGLRANEVCKITYGDLERHRIKGQQKLWIRDRKGRIGKRADTAIILNGKALEALDSWMTAANITKHDQKPLFNQFIWDFQKEDIKLDMKRISSNKALTTRAIETIVARYVTQLNLNTRFKVTPHVLRHSALTLLAREGVNLIDLKYLAGHQDVSTTMIYIHSVQSYDDHVGLYHPLNKV